LLPGRATLESLARGVTEGPRPQGGARLAAALAASPLEAALSFSKFAALTKKNWRTR